MTEEDRTQDEPLWEVQGLAMGSEKVCWTIGAPTGEAAQKEAQDRGMLRVDSCRPIVTDPHALNDWQRQVLWRLERVERMMAPIRLAAQVFLVIVLLAILLLLISTCVGLA